MRLTAPNGDKNDAAHTACNEHDAHIAMTTTHTPQRSEGTKDNGRRSTESINTFTEQCDEQGKENGRCLKERKKTHTSQRDGEDEDTS